MAPVSPELQASLESAQFLVVGAGGIGCELLKNLVLMGFKNLTVLDLDTIDVSNLNRQFLFRKEHVGHPKASSAIAAAEKLVPNPKELNMVALQDDITNTKKYDSDFFKKFRVVINALDNEKARRHVNRQCLNANVPLLEAGSTGFAGQVFPIFGGETECYDCNPMPPPKGFAVCTIRATPELPQHTIAWSKLLIELLFGPQTEQDSNLLTDLSVEVSRLRSDLTLEEPFHFAVGLARYLFIKEIEVAASHESAWISRKAPVPLTPTDESDFLRYCEGLRFVDNAEFEKFFNDNKRDVLSDPKVQLKIFLHICAKLENKRSQEGAVTLFDKDDMDAMAFVAHAANLRNLNYHIPLKSCWDAQSIAGAIIPTIASTNAIVAGLQVCQLIHMLQRMLTADTDSKPLEEVPHACRLNDLSVNRGGERSFKMITSNPLEIPSKNCQFCQSSVTTQIDLYRFEDWSITRFVNEILIKAIGLSDPAFSAPAADYFEYDPDNLDDADYLNYVKSVKLDANFARRIEVQDPQMKEEMVIVLTEDPNLGGSEENQKRHPQGFVIKAGAPRPENAVDGGTAESASGDGSVVHETGALSLSDDIVIDEEEPVEMVGSRKRPSDTEGGGDEKRQKTLSVEERVEGGATDDSEIAIID